MLALIVRPRSRQPSRPPRGANYSQAHPCTSFLRGLEPGCARRRCTCVGYSGFRCLAARSWLKVNRALGSSHTAAPPGTLPFPLGLSSLPFGFLPRPHTPPFSTLPLPQISVSLPFTSHLEASALVVIFYSRRQLTSTPRIVFCFKKEITHLVCAPDTARLHRVCVCVCVAVPKLCSRGMVPFKFHFPPVTFTLVSRLLQNGPYIPLFSCLPEQPLKAQLWPAGCISRPLPFSGAVLLVISSPS